MMLMISTQFSSNLLLFVHLTYAKYLLPKRIDNELRKRTLPAGGKYEGENER